MTDQGKQVTIKVLRYRPEKSPHIFYQSYEIPYREDQVILDLLNYIRDNVDGSLSMRWSCRMGVCGSCGMNINGQPRLACETFPSSLGTKEIVVEPLLHFPVIKDLVVDLSDFMNKLRMVKPYIIRPDERPLKEGEYLQAPREVELYRHAAMCINCMLCYEACPIYESDKSFTGPAALALGYRYLMDSRDKARDERLDVLLSGNATWKCTFAGECSKACPKNVDPAFTIQRLKLLGVQSIMMPKSRGVQKE